MDELLRDDLEVALPVRDCGIDLIAYSDLVPGAVTYIACPIHDEGGVDALLHD